MWEKVVEKVSWVLEIVPDQYKTQEMCIMAAEESPCSLSLIVLKLTRYVLKQLSQNLVPYVPDWFVTQQQVQIWHDDSNYHDKARLIRLKNRVV